MFTIIPPTLFRWNKSPSLKNTHDRCNNRCFACDVRVLISIHFTHQCYKSCRYRQYRTVAFRNKVFLQNERPKKKNVISQT